MASSLRRKQERERLIELERNGKWWTDETRASNVEQVKTPAVLDLLLAAHAVSSKPLVVHFYGQQCPGCKAMHPKLQQIMRNNGDFTFAVIDGSAEEWQDRMSADGIPSFPYFVLHNHGRVQQRLTCNLTTIQKLRDALVETRLSKSRAALATEEVVEVTQEVVSGVMEGAENILADTVGAPQAQQGDASALGTPAPGM